MSAGLYGFMDIGRLARAHQEFHEKIMRAGFTSPVETCFAHLHRRSSRDRIVIHQFAEALVGGFLNLGERQGWPEGGDPRVGAAFTRCMVQEYFEKGEHSTKTRTILQNVLASFSNIGDFNETSLRKEPENGHRPTTNRVRYDAAVTGWQKHAITRMVGNLGSKYEPRLPFFEILVNSARSSVEKETSQPFAITIHDNEKMLDARRSKLSALAMCPASVAHFTFYDSLLNTPEKFQETTKLKIGPNAKRFLEGLMYLQNVELKTQYVGNCWIKQPMRCLLVSLYIEIFTECKELTPKEAWAMTVHLYKDIQKEAGIPIIEELLEDAKIGGMKHTYASAAIEQRSQT